MRFRLPWRRKPKPEPLWVPSFHQEPRRSRSMLVIGAIVLAGVLLALMTAPRRTEDRLPLERKAQGITDLAPGPPPPPTPTPEPNANIAAPPPEPAPIAVPKSRQRREAESPEYRRGKRGGCYVETPSGGKRYVSRSKCQ